MTIPQHLKSVQASIGEWLCLALVACGICAFAALILLVCAAAAPFRWMIDRAAAREKNPCPLH